MGAFRKQDLGRLATFLAGLRQFLSQRPGHGQFLISGPGILYFWNAVGWCKGTIAKTNKDGRKTVPGGGKANFIVYYELDDEEVKHFLSLDSYGIDDRWVLLEPAA